MTSPARYRPYKALDVADVAKVPAVLARPVFGRLPFTKR